MEDKSVVVTKIWSDMFGEKNTKDEDNFFELGGDSIMALKMSEQLKQKGYTISLMEVFDDPTLGGVLEAVKPLNPVAKTSALMEEQKRSYPATVQQKWFFRKITRERDAWCEYVIISPKKPESITPEKVNKFLFEKKLLRNFKMLKNDKGLFFEMSDEMPALIKLEEGIVTNEIGEKIVKETISLENGKTCCMIYDGNGNIMIIIHHLFSDAITLKNILSAIDNLDENANFESSLYAEYAWSQYGKYGSDNGDLSYIEERNKPHESDDVVMISEEDYYETLVDISKEWRVSIESILLLQLYKSIGFLPKTVIEVERIGRDASGKWDDICGWLSFSASFDLSCAENGEQHEMAERIGKAISGLTFEKDRLDGTESENALTWNYIGNIDVSASFDSFNVKAFGQFNGKSTGRTTPIYFAVYFKEDKLCCDVNYDSLVYTKEQMKILQKTFLTNVHQLSESYNTKRTDELSSILEVMRGI